MSDETLVCSECGTEFHYLQETCPTCAARNTHEVVVSNVGTVYTGSDAKEASATYNEYVALSQRGHGRAAGEFVTWFTGGDIHREYVP